MPDKMFMHIDRDACVVHAVPWCEAIPAGGHTEAAEATDDLLRAIESGDLTACEPCSDPESIRAIDWLTAVRRYGLETANEMFP